MSTGVPGFFGQKAASGYPPIIDSVTLTELSPADGTLFGNQAFGVDVVMTDPGKPVAGKALKGYIDGTFNEPVLTDFLASAVRNDFNPDKTFYAADGSGAAFDGGAGSPTTSNFVSVAHFAQKLPGFGNLFDNHFLAVTDDNKLAYSLGGLVWEMHDDAGIPGAIFRKVQPFYTEDGVDGEPIFVACGELSGGGYFLATCYNKTSFVLDETLGSEVVSLAPGRVLYDAPQGGIGMYACTATTVYQRRDPDFDWFAIETGSGPYQYADGRFMIRNGVLYVDGAILDSSSTLTGAFDDRYDRPRAFAGDAFLFYGEGGIVNADAEGFTVQQTSTASQYSGLYGEQVYGRPGIASVTGGVTPIGDGSAPLTYARDIVGSLPAYNDRNELRSYQYNNPVSVVVGNGGQIIFAVKQTFTVQFKSDLNLSLISKYDTLTVVIDNTEQPENTWLVLDKRTVGGDDYMDLIPTGDPEYWASGLFELYATRRRFRGGSTPVGPTRRYLGMTNYAGAYNNVESLVSTDPGFTDQQTTGDTIPDIRFPIFVVDDSGFNNRFEGYVQPGATLTVELKASNLSGSDTDSDTVTPS